MRSVASSIYTNKTYQSTSLITSIVSNLFYLNFTGTNTVLFCVKKASCSNGFGFFFFLHCVVITVCVYVLCWVDKVNVAPLFQESVLA